MKYLRPAARAGAFAAPDLVLFLPRLHYAFLGLLEEALADSGLDRYIRPGMGQVLFRLYERDGPIIRDLSESMLLSPAALNGLLRRMEAARLVTCRPCETDRRAVRVRLTRRGRSIRRRLHRFHRRLVAMAQRGLSAREVAATLSALDRLFHTMRAAERQLRGKRHAARRGPSRRKGAPKT